MKEEVQSKIAEVISVIFIFVFTYTALNKFLSFSQFKSILQNLPLIGRLAPVTSVIIPSVEALISIFLIVPNTRKLALQVSAWLMILFTLYIAYMLASGSQLPCSCGGILKELSWKQHLALNIFLACLAFAGYRLSRPTQIFIAINRRSRTTV